MGKKTIGKSQGAPALWHDMKEKLLDMLADYVLEDAETIEEEMSYLHEAIGYSQPEHRDDWGNENGCMKSYNCQTPATVEYDFKYWSKEYPVGNQK